MVRHLDHVEAPMHERNCSVDAGTLFYKAADGSEVEAEFFVRTCQDESDKMRTDPQERGDRQDDFNEQYIDEVSDLMAKGCTDIHFTTAKPNPFF
jgi:hypothetical protein